MKTASWWVVFLPAWLEAATMLYRSGALASAAAAIQATISDDENADLDKVQADQLKAQAVAHAQIAAMSSFCSCCCLSFVAVLVVLRLLRLRRPLLPAAAIFSPLFLLVACCYCCTGFVVCKFRNVDSFDVGDDQEDTPAPPPQQQTTTTTAQQGKTTPSDDKPEEQQQQQNPRVWTPGADSDAPSSSSSKDHVVIDLGDSDDAKPDDAKPDELPPPPEKTVVGAEPTSSQRQHQQPGSDQDDASTQQHKRESAGSSLETETPIAPDGRPTDGPSSSPVGMGGEPDDADLNDLD